MGRPLPPDCCRCRCGMIGCNNRTRRETGDWTGGMHMPLQDPQPRIVAQGIHTLYEAMGGPFKLRCEWLELISGRRKYEASFLSPLGRALQRYRLSISKDRGYFFVTNTVKGGWYQVATWRDVAR